MAFIKVLSWGHRVLGYTTKGKAGQNVTIIKNYYSKGQQPCDKIMMWFNRSLFNAIMNTNNNHKEKFIVNNIKLQNVILKRKLKKLNETK